MKNLLKKYGFPLSLALVGMSFASTSLLAMDAAAGTHIAEPTDGDAELYLQEMLGVFQRRIAEVEESPGILKDDARANLIALFSGPEVDGSLLNLYVEQFHSRCGWEDASSDWKTNSCRRALFRALISQIYGVITMDSGTGQMKMARSGFILRVASDIAQYLNGSARRSLRLSTTGQDILSKFFMTLAELDKALLLPQQGVTPTVSRIEHWMKVVSDAWWVPAARSTAEAQADERTEEEARGRREHEARGARFGAHVDPEGLLLIENKGKMVVVNSADMGVTAEDGSRMIIRAGAGSRISLHIAPGAGVYASKVHTEGEAGRFRALPPVDGSMTDGVQIEEVSEVIHNLLQSRTSAGLNAVSAPVVDRGWDISNLKQYLRGLAAAGCFLAIDTVGHEGATTYAGVITAGVVGLIAHFAPKLFR